MTASEGENRNAAHPPTTKPSREQTSRISPFRKPFTVNSSKMPQIRYSIRQSPMICKSKSRGNLAIAPTVEFLTSGKSANESFQESFSLTMRLTMEPSARPVTSGLTAFITIPKSFNPEAPVVETASDTI